MRMRLPGLLWLFVAALLLPAARMAAQSTNTNCALVMTCPSNIVVTSCFNVQEFYNPTAYNICCGVYSTVTCTPPSGSIFIVGTTTTVTCTATDCAQNTNFCTFTVTVVPGTNCATNCLQIQCPSNIVVTSCTNIPVFYAPTVTDSCCSNWTNVLTPPSGSFFAPNTTNLVDCVVTDYCGMSNSCSFTVTVLPDTNCATNCIDLTCPPDIVVTTCSSCIDVSYSAFATNHCCFSNVGLIYSPPSGHCFPLGTNVVTVTAYDPDCASTPPVQCNFNVIVEQDANCATNCCSNCTAPFPASYSVTVYPGTNYLALDLCPGTNNTLADLLPNPPAGTDVYFWDQATQSYNIYDTYSFGAWTDGSVVLSPGEGFVLIDPSTTNSYTITFYGCTPDCPPPCMPSNGCSLVGGYGTNTCTWSNLFSCPPPCGTEFMLWNPLTQQFTIDTYVDGAWTPQTPSLPVGESAWVCVDTNAGAGLSVTCATNKTEPCGSNWEFDVPTATSCCTNEFQTTSGTGTNVFIYTTGIFTNSVCPTLSVTETWVVEDGCGNSAKCSQTVTVVNDQPPMITCPSNIVIAVTNCTSNVLVCYNPTAIDPCSGSNLTVTCSPPSCSYFAPGTTTTVTCVATNNCSGLTNICNFTVTVDCCSSVLCCGPGLGTQTINWLNLPTNGPIVSDPLSNNPVGSWYVTNMGCYGNVLVTQTCPDEVLWFVNQDMVNVPNGNGSFVDLETGYGPYAWGVGGWLDLYNSNSYDIHYTFNFYFLDGVPNPCSLVLGVIGLAADTTANVSQPMAFRGEFDLNSPLSDGYPSAHTTLNNAIPLASGSVGTLVGSADGPPLNQGYGDPVNTGWALLQPTNDLLVTNLPTGSVQGYAGPFTSLPYLSLVVDQVPGDGIGFTVGYICCTNCVTNTNTSCLEIQCPSNIVVTTCSNCAQVFYAATGTDCCTNIVELVYDPPSGTCFPIGTSNVEVTAYACGYLTNCEFTVTVMPGTNCCTNNQNLVCNGDFSAPFIGSNGYEFVTNLPCWTTTDSQGDFEIWNGTFDGITSYPDSQSIEINAQDDIDSVSQVVTGLDTNCVATFCFWYTGRQPMVNGTYNNNFTVSLTPNIGPAYFSVPLDPPAYQDLPNPGWIQFCTNFVPTTPTLTIEFFGDPHSPYPEGAHIDDVTLIQQCCSNCLQVECPPTNITVECGTKWSFDLPVATSCCRSNVTGTTTNVLIIPTTTTTNGVCPQYITQHWLIIDGCGETNTCSQTAKVVDTIPPMIYCPSNAVVVTLNSNCELVIPSVAVTASDICTPLCDLVYSQSPPAGTIVPGPDATVTITVTDLCGNSNSCQVQVDGLPKAGSGLVVVWPSNVLVTNCVVPCVTVKAADCACPLQLPRVTQSPPCGSLIGPGTTVIQVTVTDCNGAVEIKDIPLTIVGEESFLGALTNTGISVTGTLQANGTVDPHYFAGPVSGPPVGYTAPDAWVTTNQWGWLEITHVSQWIAPVPFVDLASCPGGNFTYTNQFTLPAGGNPATASISGRWAADNGAVIMSINGHPTPNTVAVPFGFKYWTPFTISSGFVPGLNTILFVVTNQGASPSGLRVEYLAASVYCSNCSPAAITSISSSQSLQEGSTAVFNVKAEGTPPLSYQWQYNDANINGATNSALQIPSITYSNAGLYSVSVANPCGNTTGKIPLQVTPALPWPNALWNVANLRNPLQATFGPNLIMAGTGSATNFVLSTGTTEDFGLPDPGGQVVNVMEIQPQAVGQGEPTLEVPVVAASGNASDTNYTLIMDIYEPDTSLGTPSTLFASIACCVSNLGSGGQDGVGLTMDASNLLHITGSTGGVPFDYPATVPLPVDSWNRIAFVVDNPEDGIGANMMAYLNGGNVININPCTCCVITFTNINWTTGSPTVFTAPTTAASPNGEFFVAGIQFHAIAMTPQMIAGIGSPVAGPAPVNSTLAGPAPVLTATLVDGAVNISWSGSPYALQETTDLNNSDWVNSTLPFTESTGTSGNLLTTAVVTPAPNAPGKFYRLVFAP